MNKISIIIPCYNEETSIPLFYGSVKNVLAKMDVEYELIFIDDGSKDNTLGELQKLGSQDNSVTYLSFARNFGKEAAMYAGFENVTGDYVAVMDVDMQDPPSLLPEMYDILLNRNYDSVATRRISRKGESRVRSFFARLFYKIVNKISDAEIIDGARDFRLMNRKMVDAIVSMSEYNRFSKGLFGWVGFRTYWLPFENVERAAGTTSWGFWGLVKYAISGIIDFSNFPLSIASWLGCFTTFVSFVMLMVIVVRQLIFGDPVAGWASTICIILFMGGLQLSLLGIMGQYLAKTYLETKKRPHYIIAKSNRDDIKKIG